MNKIEAETIRDPRWASEDGTRVNCIVKFSHLKDEHEFTAFAFDCESHGREIWGRCVNGEFGIIKSYQPLENMGEMPFNELPDEFKDINSFLEIVNSENAKKSFPIVAILWGSFLDETLGELLANYKALNSDANVKADKLHQKIIKAFEYQLIDGNQKSRLKHICYIRNEVAHNWRLTLDDKEFSGHLKSLYELDHAELFEYVEDLDFLLQMILSGSCAKAALEIKNIAEALH